MPMGSAGARLVAFSVLSLCPAARFRVLGLFQQLHIVPVCHNYLIDFPNLRMVVSQGERLHFSNEGKIVWRRDAGGSIYCPCANEPVGVFLTYGQPVRWNTVNGQLMVRYLHVRGQHRVWFWIHAFSKHFRTSRFPSLLNLQYFAQ